MKTVPSLVASSTVGVAAVGLAFGKPEQTTPERPSSKKRKVAELADGNTILQGTNSPVSRPATSSTMITPESRTSRRPTSSSLHTPIIHQKPPLTHQNLPNMSSARRLSMVKAAETGGHDYTGEELHRRDSVSSRGSWMKRLSTFPSSHSSPRSSIGPDSPSIQLSNSSAAPILSTPTNTPTQLPPNKLVKREPPGRSASDGPVSRTRSRGSVPTLRRPATSHQRSVTLQQQFKDDSVARETAFETPTKLPTSLHRFHSAFNSPQSWRQYFEARTTRVSKERHSGFGGEGSVPNSQPTARRIVQDESARPTLVKPEMITSSTPSNLVYYDESFAFDDTADLAENEEAREANETISQSPERLERQKRARRSLSMHFSSPSSWVTRGGSLRGKRSDATGGGTGGTRFSSAPGPILPARSTTSHGARNRAVLDPAVFDRKTHTSATNHINIHNDPFEVGFSSRNRNTSLPLPPLSRLSSFNADLARLGQSSSSSSAPRRSPTSPLPQTTTTTASTSLTSTHVSPSLQSYYVNNSKTPRTSEVADRASTLVGSDNETKGFGTSGDEDDMESETVFDSLRSGATNSVRSHHTPLDTMFDESPPSTTGQSKNKRQSIHEMLINGGYQEENDRIVEEDEGMPTPVKASRSTPRAQFETPVRHGTIVNPDFPSAPTFSLAARDFSRLSLDDEDDDEDWTRDEENLNVGHLSPPNSMNSRKVSPIIREALADVTHTGSTKGNSTPVDRPKSNLFDWAEPSSAEKVDHMGNSPRPKTAHGKQHADSRGGRTLGRRGPTALHVRSQSVPVVPDVAGQRELSKLTPKFGTWGLGAKGVSEDWDNDFEFDSLDNDDVDEGESKMEKSGMLVPPAIQASQASVVGHVGQIREVCLLVEDLKRLRLLAKEKHMLDGKYASLWKEAEGIIALAVPDEDDPPLSNSQSPPPVAQSPPSVVFEQEDERYIDQGHAAEDLERPDSPIEVLNRHGRPTGFIYDGSTVRRRSVFSPGDDIFGAGTLKSPPSRDNLRIPSTATRNPSMRSTSDVARSVMETMHQHRSTSDPLLKNLTYEPMSKMPFDTTSLRDLVHRANVLTRTLSDLINKSDAGFETPEGSPHPHRESSPAFTRVFTDPMQSPPKHLPRSQSNNSVLSDTIDSSPTRNLSQRMHMMSVA